MSNPKSPDEQLVLLAALAFLHWRDTGNFPELMSKQIDGQKLAEALDRLSVIDTPEVVECVIEVGHITNSKVATWRNKLHPTMTVCNRHRSHYDEREDLGPYDWEPIDG